MTQAANEAQVKRPRYYVYFDVKHIDVLDLGREADWIAVLNQDKHLLEDNDIQSLVDQAIDCTPNALAFQPVEWMGGVVGLFFEEYADNAYAVMIDRTVDPYTIAP